MSEQKFSCEKTGQVMPKQLTAADAAKSLRALADDHEGWVAEAKTPSEAGYHMARVLILRTASDFLESETEATIARLTADLEQWQTWGVIEIAVRNPNVASYMDHWEKRTLAAEAERDALREHLADVTADVKQRCSDHPNEPRELVCVECFESELIATARAERDALRRERDASFSAQKVDTPRQDCSQLGHLYGASGRCMFCDAPPPDVAAYLKDGETPAECIARNRGDVDTALGLLAKVTEDRDALLAALRQLREDLREREQRLCRLADSATSMHADRLAATAEGFGYSADRLDTLLAGLGRRQEHEEKSDAR